MIYELLSAVGGLGLLAQTVLGAVHDGAGAHGSVPAHGNGHLHTSASVHPATDAPAGATVSANHLASHGHPSPLAPLLGLLSPLSLFTLCLGTGITGLLLQSRWQNPFSVGFAAAAGGIGLYALVVRPLWKLVFQFASKPADTLSASVAKEAVADSRFDSSGRGIVRLVVDEQLVRILAQLEADDVANGMVVMTGDVLIVTQIDRQRNSCRVTRF